MTRRRFYAPPSAFHKNYVTLVEDEARHLREVLRLKPGDEVSVFDGEGKEFLGRIEESRRDSARLEVLGEVEPARPESPLHLTLAVALLKGEKFDLVVQKATELGVTEIIPVISKYADVRLRDESDAAKRVKRWQRIAMEAAKQSGRAFVPDVVAAVKFESLVNSATQPGRLLFSERDGKTLDQIKQKLTSSDQIIAVVGSEGGWSDEELGAAAESGWSIITLGGRILRAETAAIAITALLEHILGDLA